MNPNPSVTSLLRAAAMDANRLAHRVRVVILALVALRLVLIAHDELLAGVVKHWIALSAMGLGALASFWFAGKNRVHRDYALVGSTLLDAVLATVVILPAVVWPKAAFLGVLRAPDIIIFPVVIAGAGLRLSVTAARLGSFGAILGLGLLVALDVSLNPDRVHYGAGDALLTLAILIGSAMLAQGFVHFVRRLLDQTAMQTSETARIRQQFGAYVSEEFAELVLGTRPATAQRTHAVVLFSDLRGFTTYSEAAAPDALTDELNAYFAAMVEAIRAHGGVIDKYIGDAIMVVFGLPAAGEADHADAIRAVIAMQEALCKHNAVRATHGLPPLSQGIGVHAGEVVAGPVGAAERLQFTVLGDTVNVASRLEAATKTHAVDVLISAVVVARARAESPDLPELIALRDVPLRGRTDSVPTFTLDAVHSKGAPTASHKNSTSGAP